jgi:hypothetical protein
MGGIEPETLELAVGGPDDELELPRRGRLHGPGAGDFLGVRGLTSDMEQKVKR